MNNLPIDASTPPPLSELIPAGLRESRRRLPLLVVLFTLIAIAGLVTAWTWPKHYHASTTILISEDNIIRQLMDGRAVPTSVYDRAAIAREVMFSRRVMDEVLAAGGWLDDNPDRAERERIAAQIEGRTSVSTPQGRSSDREPNDNLITITYWDVEAERALVVTEQLAALFMAESADAKLRESREAYQFIAEQVEGYHARLREAEVQLKAFRDAREYSLPGTGPEVSARIAEMHRDIEQWRVAHMDMLSREAKLSAQLSGLDTETALDNYQGQLRARIAAAQQSLDEKLLDLTPRHPDVVRLRGQIDDLRAELDSAGERVRAGAPVPEFNPLQGELSSALASVRQEIAGQVARIRAAEAMLESEIDRARRVAVSDLELAELSRNHSVNQTIYEDLVGRLENARLSMRLDELGRGLTFNIQEPASVPAQPSGLRFAHLAAGSLVAATAAPLALLMLFVRIDPRVRSPRAIERMTQLPVIATIPTYHTRRERRRFNLKIRAAGFLVLAVLIAYGVAGWLRVVGGA